MYRNIIHIHYILRTCLFVCMCICMCVRLIDISGGRQRTCNWISKISSPIHPFDCSHYPSLSLSSNFWHTFNTAALLRRGRLTIPRRCSILRNGSGLPSYNIVVFVPRDFSDVSPALVTICHMFCHQFIMYIVCYIIRAPKYVVGTDVSVFVKHCDFWFILYDFRCTIIKLLSLSPQRAIII